MESNELVQSLRNFTGTTNYHKWNVFFRNFVMTDGAKYLAEEAGAYWLMDAIASHYGSYKNEDFVVAKLEHGIEWWKLTLEDGNDKVLATQVIEYSDFPLDEITLYVLPQDGLRVILLPSEY